MARTKSLVIAVVLATGALAASAAGASATPQWGACLKAEPKNTGNFKDKVCSSASEPGEGKYELVAGSVGKGRRFKIKGLGPQALHIVVPGSGDVPITCKKVSGTGVPVAPNSEKEVELEFRKCTTEEGAVPCENVSKETIKTEPLTGVLAEVEGKVGTILSPEAGTHLAVFSCGAVAPKVPVIGQVFGEYTGATDVISKASVGHFEVGPYLGELEDENYGHRRYTPLVNPPSAEPPAHGVLLFEFHQLENECDELPSACKTFFYPIGLEGAMEAKGEALMIKT